MDNHEVNEMNKDNEFALLVVLPIVLVLAVVAFILVGMA